VRQLVVVALVRVAAVCLSQSGTAAILFLSHPQRGQIMSLRAWSLFEVARHLIVAAIGIGLAWYTLAAGVVR